MFQTTRGYYCFNKQDCLNWLLCATRLCLPPEIVYYIAKHMFYNFIPRFIFNGQVFTQQQSKVMYNVLIKQHSRTVLDWKRFTGRHTCARALAAYEMLNSVKHIVFVDVDRRRSKQNCKIVVDYLRSDPDHSNIIQLNEECIKLENGAICWFKPSYWIMRTQCTVDLLISFVENLQQVKAKQVVYFKEC